MVFLVFCMRAICHLTFLFGKKRIGHSVAVALIGPVRWILPWPAPFSFLLIVFLVRLQSPCRFSIALREPETLCRLWTPSHPTSLFADKLGMSPQLHRRALLILVCISGERNQESCGYYHHESQFTATPCGVSLLCKMALFVLGASKSPINHTKLCPQHTEYQQKWECCLEFTGLPGLPGVTNTSWWRMTQARSLLSVFIVYSIIFYAYQL